MVEKVLIIQILMLLVFAYDYWWLRTPYYQTALAAWGWDYNNWNIIWDSGTAVVSGYSYPYSNLRVCFGLSIRTQK